MSKKPYVTGLTSEIPQGETTELLKKKYMQQALIRDALKSQMNRRQQYVDHEKNENLKIDKILNENNNMFIEIERKKKEGEKSKVIDFWNKELQLSESLKAIKMK